MLSQKIDHNTQYQSERASDDGDVDDECDAAINFNGHVGGEEIQVPGNSLLLWNSARVINHNLLNDGKKYLKCFSYESFKMVRCLIDRKIKLFTVGSYTYLTQLNRN